MPTIQMQSCMRSIREMMNTKVSILSPRYNISPLPFSLSFPTVVLLKILQYWPPDLRWATIVVVMQITVVKAKIKLQQHFACNELAHYLVTHYQLHLNCTIFVRTLVLHLESS